MRSLLIILAPDAGAISIMRPSTRAGTPITNDLGGTFGPSRSTGQFFFTASIFPPMPPEVIRTALPYNSKSSTGGRTETGHTSLNICQFQSLAPHADRGAGSLIDDDLVHAVPELDITPGPLLRGSLDRLCEHANDFRASSPRQMESRHRVSVAASAVTSAFSPIQQWRISGPGSLHTYPSLSVAKLTNASAHCRGQWSSLSRSKPAELNQSCRASSRLSLIPTRRCSVELTQKRPPKDQKACPPRLASLSWSTMRRSMLEEALPRFHEFPCRGIASIPTVGGVRDRQRRQTCSHTYARTGFVLRSACDQLAEHVGLYQSHKDRLGRRERFSLGYQTGTFFIAYPPRLVEMLLGHPLVTCPISSQLGLA